MPGPIFNHFNAKKTNKLRCSLNHVQSLGMEKRKYILKFLVNDINPFYGVLVSR